MGYQTPGNYIEEGSGGSKSIEGAASGIAAFIGIAQKGEVGVTTQVTGFDEYVEKFGGHIPNGYLSYAVENFFIEAGKGARLYVTRTVHYSDANLASSKTSKAATNSFKDAGNVDVLKVTASSDGVWGNNLKIKISDPSSGDATQFKLEVFAGNSTDPLEIFDNYTVAQIDGLKGKNVDLDALGSNRPANTVANVALTGGDDGLTGISDSDYIGTAAAGNGLYSLDVIDDSLNIAVPGVCTRAVQVAGSAYAENRKTSFFISDIPLGLTYTEARDYKLAKGTFNGSAALSSPFMAVYYPWYYAKDSASSSGKKLVPPSAAMAGVFARTAGTRGVHKAPAGVEDGRLRSAIGIERVVTDPQQAELNPNGINVIRSFSDAGIVAWGARTCSSDPEWRYINVRLLFNYIEESLKKGTKWAVFEPNDSILWGKLKIAIKSFLNREFKKGAFADPNDPTKSYYVECDATLNTKSVIDAGEVIADTGIAPSKPGEFIRIRIKQWDGGALVTEIGA